MVSQIQEAYGGSDADSSSAGASAGDDLAEEIHDDLAEEIHDDLADAMPEPVPWAVDAPSGSAMGAGGELMGDPWAAPLQTHETDASVSPPSSSEAAPMADPWAAPPSSGESDTGGSWGWGGDNGDGGGADSGWDSGGCGGGCGGD